MAAISNPSSRRVRTPRYILARTASGRPALQHRVNQPYDDYTLCGQYIAGWTRYHMDQKIAPILCMKCAKYPDDYDPPDRMPAQVAIEAAKKGLQDAAKSKARRSRKPATRRAGGRRG